MNFIAIRVDEEFNAEKFWENLNGRFPDLCSSLRSNNCAIVSESLWESIQMIPGFDGGPFHAMNALINLGSIGSGWDDVASRKHSCFE